MAVSTELGTGAANTKTWISAAGRYKRHAYLCDMTDSVTRAILKKLKFHSMSTVYQNDLIDQHQLLTPFYFYGVLNKSKESPTAQKN